MFLWRLFRGARIRLAMTLIPIMAWIISHQGLRESMLWVLLAMFAVVKLGEKPVVAKRVLPEPVVDPPPVTLAPAGS